MAKKSTPSTALQFVFSGAELKKITDRNPDKVLFTITVEEAVTKDGKKVGALKIQATPTFKGGKKKLMATPQATDGCPIPPCNNQ
jgi:hypothetical protein